ALRHTFVEARLGKELTEAAKKRGDPPRRPSPLQQFAVLLSRACVLRLARWQGLALLLGIAVALGGLARLGKTDRRHPLVTVGCDPDRPPPPDECADQGMRDLVCGSRVSPATERIPDARGGLLSMLMAVLLPLLVVSAGALVSERTIFRNESIAGVRPGA